MKKYLDKYFEKAKKTTYSKPLVSEGEARELIAGSDKGIIRSKYHISNRKGVLKMLAYSSIAVLFISAMLFFFSNGIKYDSLNKTGSLTNQENFNSGNQREAKNKSFAGINEGNPISSQNQVNPDDPDSANSINNDNKHENNYVISLEPSNKAPKVTIPVLCMNDKELESINILKTPEGYEFIMESVYDLKKEGYLISNLEKNKYPPKGIYHQKHILTNNEVKRDYLPYKGWDMLKSGGTFPVSYYKNTIQKNGGSTSYWTSSSSPLINEKIGQALSSERSILDTTIINFDKKIEGGLKGVMFLETVKYKFRNASKLLPVIFKWEDEKGINRAVVWFVPTKELIGKLPAKYNDYASKYIKPVEYIDFENASAPNFSMKNVQKVQNPPKSFIGIEKIELTLDELKKIGINFENGKYTAHTQEKIDFYKILKQFPDITPTFEKKMAELGYPKDFKTVYLRSKLFVDTVEVRGTELQYGGWNTSIPSPTLPVAATVETCSYTFNKYTGNYEKLTGDIMFITNSPLLPKDTLILDNESGGKFRPNIDRLSPVHITMGTKFNSDSSKINYGDISFWFFVNKEFAELLPERYRVPILKELELISGIENGEIEPAEACNALKGERSFFGLCSLTSGHLGNISVYPNPFRGTVFNLRLISKNTCEITIDLFDLSGKLIKSLSKSQIQQPGEQNIVITLSDKLSDGLYLVKISDDKGNQVIQKMIVKN